MSNKKDDASESLDGFEERVIGIIKEREAALAEEEDEEPEEGEVTGEHFMGIYGAITEERASEIVSTGLVLSTMADKGELEAAEKKVNLCISTHGGSAVEMFAIYDVMRTLKGQGFEITTMGLGKVMSAGVLLLAAGTTGKRKIGKHCRVMIHSVVGGSAGSLHNIENEIEEMKWAQELYAKALVTETSMSTRKIKSYLKKGTNSYLSAEEAVALGIVDEII